MFGCDIASAGQNDDRQFHCSLSSRGMSSSSSGNCSTGQRASWERIRHWRQAPGSRGKVASSEKLETQKFACVNRSLVRSGSVTHFNPITQFKLIYLANSKSTEVKRGSNAASECTLLLSRFWYSGLEFLCF